MRTIAFILACVSAMVCFRAGANDGIGAFERTKEFYYENLPADAYYLYSTPTAAVENYVEDIDREKCSCRGIKLYGKVKVVESFADIKVKIVESFPDLRVKLVSSFPDVCGEWRFVESFPDFTIKLVESFPDLTIKFTDSFPGM